MRNLTIREGDVVGQERIGIGLILPVYPNVKGNAVGFVLEMSQRISSENRTVHDVLHIAGLPSTIRLGQSRGDRPSGGHVCEFDRVPPILMIREVKKTIDGVDVQDVFRHTGRTGVE